MSTNMADLMAPLAKFVVFISETANCSVWLRVFDHLVSDNLERGVSHTVRLDTNACR